MRGRGAVSVMKRSVRNSHIGVEVDKNSPGDSDRPAGLVSAVSNGYTGVQLARLRGEAAAAYVSGTQSG